MWFEIADVTRGAGIYRAKYLHTQTFCCQFFHIIIIVVIIIIIIMITQLLKYFAWKCEKSESFLAHSMVAGSMVALAQSFPSKALGGGAVEGGLFSGKCTLMKGLLPSLLGRGHGRAVNWQSLYLTFYFSDLLSLEDQTQNVTEFPSIKPAGKGLSKSHMSVCPELCSQISISDSLRTTPPSIHHDGSPARITKHADPKVALACNNK